MQIIKCYLSNQQMIDSTALDTIRQTNIIKQSVAPKKQSEDKIQFKLKDKYIPPL